MSQLLKLSSAEVDALSQIMSKGNVLLETPKCSA